MTGLLINRNQQFERLTNQIWENQQRPVTKKDFTEYNLVIDGLPYDKFTKAEFYKCASILQREGKILQFKKTIPAHYFPSNATVKTNRIGIRSSDSLTVTKSQTPPQSPCTQGGSFAIKFSQETV